jgi:hypothetical protein
MPVGSAGYFSLMATTGVPIDQGRYRMCYHWEIALQARDLDDPEDATIKARIPATMVSRGGFNAKAPRRKLAGTEKAVDTLVALGQDQPDKARVMKYIGQLVVDGYAEWQMLDNGEVEVRLTSGEIYLLSKATILRLA